MKYFLNKIKMNYSLIPKGQSTLTKVKAFEKYSMKHTKALTFKVKLLPSILHLNIIFML